MEEQNYAKCIFFYNTSVTLSNFRKNTPLGVISLHCTFCLSNIFIKTATSKISKYSVTEEKRKMKNI